MPATSNKSIKQRKLRIPPTKKSYLLSDSSLYRLRTKSKLAKELFSTFPRIKKLTLDSNYRIFSIEKPDGKERWIETPKNDLNVIHTRIASLLLRIKQPNFVHSGRKGRSNITNAKAHTGKHPVLTMDLKNFYPSVSKKSVYHFFHDTMMTAPDVAGVLAELCTIEGHIPTGSRISMPLSYWANDKMFSAISELCKSENINMTVYVDDLTFSGTSVNHAFRRNIEKIINSAGLTVHPNKTRLYKPSEAKLITGVIVEGNGIKVRNKHHKAIHNLFSERYLAEKEAEIKAIDKKLLGHLTAAGQVEPKFKQRAQTLRVTHPQL